MSGSGDRDAPCPVPLEAERIVRWLDAPERNDCRARIPVGKIHVFRRVDSTNTLAKDALSSCGRLLGPEGKLLQAARELDGSVFVADSQSGGRGRLGRSFFSPPGSGLYMSLVCVPPGGVRNPALITASAAVGVCRALRSVCAVDAGIKWVNDIFLRGRKVCGILTEGAVDAESGCVPAAVIGIGVNVSEGPDGFPPEIAAVAGSLAGRDSGLVDRNRLAAAVSTEVFRAVGAALSGSGPVLEEYRARSVFAPGQRLTVCPVAGSTERSFRAFYEGIDCEARLLVSLPDGSRLSLDSGEVSLRSPAFSRSWRAP